MDSLREISTKCIRMRHEKGVDETEELHDTFILASILMTLQQEDVRLAIGP